MGALNRSASEAFQKKTFCIGYFVNQKRRSSVTVVSTAIVSLSVEMYWSFEVNFMVIFAGMLGKIDINGAFNLS